MNESKHPTPYREEEFGYPGARIDGKQTIGTLLLLSPPATLGEAFGRWFSTASAADLASLRDRMQTEVGESRAYVETVKCSEVGGNVRISVSVRYPLDDDEAPLQAALEATLAEWLRDRLVASAT